MTPRSMRVCFLIDSLEHGGAERVLVAVAPELVSRGWHVRVDVLTDRVDAGFRARLERRGVEVRTHGFSRTLDPAGWRRLRRSLDGFDATVVHSHLEAADVVACLRRRRLGPVVSTQHVVGEPVGWRAALRHAMHEFVLRRARVVIAVSAAGRDHLVRRVGASGPEIEVLPNGVEDVEPCSDAARRAVRAELGLDGHEPLVACCAVLRPLKGIQHLIDAVAGDELASVRVVVIGDGPHRGRLEQQVRELGLERRVLFTGHRDDAVRIIGAADIFVHPTLQDVFPTSIIEAMACGRPVVASRTGGVPELVDDEVTGTLVQPGEASALAGAIAAYVADPQRRVRHGAAGRASYEAHFTLSRQVDRLEDLYRRVGRWP